MADRYLLESGAPDGYLLEDGSGVLILEQQPAAADTIEGLSRIERGEKIAPAASLGGVLEE